MQINLVDVYQGKPLPPEHESLCFAIEFNGKDHTLAAETLDPIMTTLIERLKTDYHLSLRQ